VRVEEREITFSSQRGGSFPTRSKPARKEKGSPIKNNQEGERPYYSPADSEDGGEPRRYKPVNRLFWPSWQSAHVPQMPRTRQTPHKHWAICPQTF